MKNGTTLEELEAMLERQDRDLAEAQQAFEEVVAEHPGLRFEIPPPFFAELEEACDRRATLAAAATTLTFAMRG